MGVNLGEDAAPFFSDRVRSRILREMADVSSTSGNSLMTGEESRRKVRSARMLSGSGQ